MSKLILALDGGGIRGAATAQFLNRIESVLKHDHGTSIRDCVDFYAGTSTGSILALGLANTDLPIAVINQLFGYEIGQQTFAENRGWFEWDGVNAPRYDGAGKSRVLKQHFGYSRIRDVKPGKHVLAVSYDIQSRKPVVIKSTDPTFDSVYAWQVADASSAAPTYFPTSALEAGDPEEHLWLVDGGVIANNPTLCAMAEARRAWEISIDEMRILSIGTGYRTRKINGPESSHWGALQWFTKGQILELLTDERVVAYQALTLSRPGNYIRVNAELRPQPGLPLAPDDALDDNSRCNIKRLRQMGDFWFDQYGEPVVDLLLDRYRGPSLDRIEPATGKPIRH